jgi:hypothetical protein
MRLRTTTICIGLAACTPEDDDWQEWLSPVDFEGSQAIEFGSAVGIGTVEVPVRLVNSYKASIPGTELNISVDGPTASAESSTVSLDAQGRGVVRVNVGGPEMFTVTATSSADDAEVGASIMAYATSVPMPTYALGSVSAMDSSLEEDAHRIALGSNGVTIAVADELWWHPLDSSPAYRVANLPADLEGMRSAHVDADGILDLVTWSGAQVMLFRGHPEGGLSWGGGWIGDSGEVAGVAIADLDGNRTTDLAVGLTGNGAGVVQLLSGTGAWHFEAMGRPLELNHGIYGISAADEGNDGRPDVTVIAETHDQMRRYTMSSDGWVGASTFNLSSADGSECGEGSELLPNADLDGDGKLEVIISGPPEDSPHELIFFILGDTIKHYPLAYESYHVDLADMNNDGSTDIALLEDDTLHYIHYDGADFKDDSINLVAAGGPVAAGDMDHDGAGDLAVASDGVSFTRGKINDTGGWSRDIGDWESFSTSLLTEPIVYDIDGDGISDVIGLTSNGSQVEVSAWRLLNDSESTEMLYIGNLELGTATVAHKLIRCESDGYKDYYALAEDEDGERIYRFSVSSSTITSSSQTATDGTIMHCGTGWDSDSFTPYTVVVSNSSGSWTSYRRGLTEDGSGSMGSVNDFAMLPNEVVGCSEDGCSMVALDIDGDGSSEVATMDSSGLSVDWGDGSGTTHHSGSGLLSIADADGDGSEDLIATDLDMGRIWIYRNLGNGLAPPVGLHTTREMGSRVHFGDVSGDDVPELLLIDVDGRIIHSDTTEADPASSW